MQGSFIRAALSNKTTCCFLHTFQTTCRFRHSGQEKEAIRQRFGRRVLNRLWKRKLNKHNIHKTPNSERERESALMADKGGAAPTTYSPSPSKKKTTKPIFKNDDVDWVRPDGRGFHHCRPAFFRTGAVNSASGSAYAEFGNTKVIVSVFGPRESKKAMMYSDIGRLNCNVSYTTFATPVRGQGSDDKEFSSMLHKALEGAIILESFPKTTVDVFALVLESGGSDLPVVISCASVALADAGIMMYDLVTSVSLSGLGKHLVIDPILEEESYQDGSLMISCMPSRYEVTQLTITGEWSTAKIDQGMKLCMDACIKLVEIMRSCLKESASAPEE